MTTPGTSTYPSNRSAVEDAEFQFQQELRAMFAVDTQQHLQTYFTLVQQLTAQSWTADIQHIYRAVHTVKGGAVTVDADAMLHAATVLEDLLSDLRYLEQAPPLEDGQLSRILLEAGELLSSSIEISETGEQAIAQVRPTVQRLQTIHEQVKQRYVPDWSELKQVHQEFAEQGLDLVVLELEMALGSMPDQESVPEVAIETARQTVMQLTQIGRDLQFSEGWTVLLQQCETLISQADSSLWHSVWPQMFEGLKACAKQGGELNIEPQLIQILCSPMFRLPEIDAIAEVSLSLPELPELPAMSALEMDDILNIDDISDLDGLDDLAFDALDMPDAFASLDPFATISEGHFKFSDLQDLSRLSEDNAAIQDFLDFQLLEEKKKREDLDALISLDEANPLLNSLNDLGGLDNLDGLDDLSSLDEIDGLESLGELENLSELNGLESLNNLKTLGASDSLDGLEELDISGDLSDLSILTLGDPNDLSILNLGDLGDLDNLGNLSDLDSLGDLNGLDEWDDPELVTFRSEAESLDFSNLEPVLEPLLSPTDIGLFPQNEAIPAPVAVETTPVIPEATPSKQVVQIPVPLERLDQSAQQVVETLLSARSVMNSSQKLQSQMTQLNSLTQESAQFVTRLRQLQDDYALLRNLSDEQDSSNNLALERYRQGYSTINRLLENILRMSELGQEIETVNQQAVDRLDQLDRSIVRLKDGIETSRLIPFRNLTLRSKAILRDLTNRYGKPAELAVTGEQVELDAGIVQQLEPLLLHLLRNAYDHGLEPIEERLANGKPMQGKIALSLQRRGNLYRLTLEDDGRGMDSDAIRRQAQEKGFPLTQTRTAAELLAVLCQPGFSSRSTVSEVSGRGVGMDVVAGQIEAMGGKLNLQTRPGQGTSFMLEIPAPQLLVPCVLIQVGDRTIALPTEEILETVLISSIPTRPSETKESLCTWTLTTSRGEAQGFDLSHYWSNPTQSQGIDKGRSLPDTAICIRTRQENGAVNPSDLWLIADDLLGQEDLLINPLPSPLIAPAGLLGVSLQPDGRLISILDPVALAEVIQSAPVVAEDVSTPAIAAEPESSAITILVVDDAALMRRRMEGSLHTYGFATHTCEDGVEALNWLQTNGLPDLMITDVEMPNMDGFTLIDRCRQSGMEMPILVVSSRLSEEWGGEAKRLGATDYLNKGFSTAALIDKVNQCLGVAVAMVKE
jgi:chemotaxis protein histidine kinase CheA/CheY-like chemotaxis protein